MMTKLIDKIDSHLYKSWNESSNLKTTSFNQTNIIFGHNGAGKSSLANGIAKTYLASNDRSSSRFFSSKFVESTLLLEDKSGIRGVVSNFSKKDVDIEKKVAKNKKKINVLVTDIQKHTKIAEDLTLKTDDILKEIVRRRKDKNTKINNKPDNKTIQEKIALWVKDYDDVSKVFPKEDYNSITGNADFTAESEQINFLSFPVFPEVDESIHSEIVEILSTPYLSVDIPEHEVVSWLEDGLHIHENKSNCEFCGSDIEITKIKNRVDAYLNNTKYKATLKLEDYKRTLINLQAIAKSLIDGRDLYKQTLGLANNQIRLDDIQINITQINGFINEYIDRKLSAMESKIAVDTKIIESSVINVRDAITALEEIKKQNVKNITDKINRLEILVKGAIGLEVKNSEVIIDNLAKIDAANEQSEILNSQQNKLETLNNRLLTEKSDLSDFAEYLNAVLAELGLRFALLPRGKVYILKNTDGSSLKLDDISDGERNLLSLIYFYYEMLGGASGDIKDNIKVIVIDDPISSLDDNNKFYITEVIRTILNQKSAQVFILTHSWDDFCNIAYGRTGDDGTSLFEIKKILGTSNINILNGNKLLSPYAMLYREVDSFRQKDVNEVPYEEVLHMPNTMRRILEEYVKFRVDIDFATAGKNGEISKAMFGEEFNNLSNTKKQKLNQLLAVCNILSHKANQPKNPSEIHDSAKFLIGSIEQYDKYHHLKMRGV